MKLNNRFIFGILSLLLAAVIAFVALPTIARQTNGKEEIVRITQPVLKGEQISYLVRLSFWNSFRAADTGTCASSVSLTKEASRRKNGPLVGIMLSEPSRSYRASYSVSPLPDTRRPRVSSRFVQSYQERSVQ